MKHILSILFLILLSCNSSQKKLVLKIEKIYGLSNASTVTLNKQKIGQVKIVMNKKYDEIIIESNNIDVSKIPIDSKLQISDDIKSKKLKLNIVIGTSFKYFKSGDTLNQSKTNVEKELEKQILIGDSLFVSKEKKSLRKDERE